MSARVGALLSHTNSNDTYNTTILTNNKNHSSNGNKEGACVISTDVNLFSDELRGGFVGVSDVLRWFERNRTQALGGPSGLRALQLRGAEQEGRARCKAQIFGGFIVLQ